MASPILYWPSYVPRMGTGAAPQSASARWADRLVKMSGDDLRAFTLLHPHGTIVLVRKLDRSTSCYDGILDGGAGIGEAKRVDMSVDELVSWLHEDATHGDVRRRSLDAPLCFVLEPWLDDPVLPSEIVGALANRFPGSWMLARASGLVRASTMIVDRQRSLRDLGRRERAQLGLLDRISLRAPRVGHILAALHREPDSPPVHAYVLRMVFPF